MSRLSIRAAIVLLALRLLWMYLIPAWNEISTDFPNYYTAAWAVHHEQSLQNLYDPSWFQQETERAGMPGRIAVFDSFAPFSAMVMWPIANFSPLAAKRMWVVISLIALSITVLVLAKSLGAPVDSVLLVALLGGDALGNNFAFGQFYIILALLMTIAMVYMTQRPALAGWCLSFAALVKVFPVLLLGYFVALRHWRAFAWTVIGLVALSLVGIAVMGWAPHRVYVEEVWSRSFRGEVQDPYNVQSNSLQALLRRALVFEPGLNPRPIINAPALYFFLRPFLVACILLFTVGAVYDRPGGHRPPLQLGTLIAGLMLTIPAQASYQQVLLFPGIAAAIHNQRNNWWRFAYGAAFALICSNYMGALSRFDSGITMLAAFPRAWLVLALWIGLIYQAEHRRWLGAVLAAATLIAGVSAFFEYQRWNLDNLDHAVMSNPEAGGFIETYPRFTSAGLTYLTVRRDGIFRREPDGSETPVRGDETVNDRASTPDGNFVASSEWVNGRYRISEWSRATGQTQTVLEGSADYRYPAYDPTGRWLAFATNRTGNWDIGRLSRSEGRQEILTSSKANDLMPAYSADGNTIYFASDRRRGYRFTAIYAIAR